MAAGRPARRPGEIGPVKRCGSAGVKRISGVQRRATLAGAPGLEPGFTDPKSGVLPIAPRPNGPSGRDYSTRRRANYHHGKRGRGEAFANGRRFDTGLKWRKLRPYGRDAPLGSGIPSHSLGGISPSLAASSQLSVPARVSPMLALSTPSQKSVAAWLVVFLADAGAEGSALGSTFSAARGAVTAGAGGGSGPVFLRSGPVFFLRAGSGLAAAGARASAGSWPPAAPRSRSMFSRSSAACRP